MNASRFCAFLLLLPIILVAASARAVTYTATPLHPTGFEYSLAQGISGTSQVGVGYGETTDFFPHALFWNGSADSMIDLHPSGFGQSEALGVSGSTQVGYGYPTGSINSRALL